jgi:hypothetical protein
LRIVVADEYEVWHPAYLFLRKLIDALRIVRGDASDLVLPQQDSEEFKSLARRLGYNQKDRRAGAAQLAAEIQHHMKNLNASFLNRFKLS